MGWVFLALSVVFYGFANFLQAIAATSERGTTRFGVRTLFRLATHRTYVAGILAQFLGFVCAFFARADLPLFLVQSAAAGGLGLTTLLGVLILKWRLPTIELVLLGMLAFGLLALILSAEQSPSEPLNLFEVVLLAGTAIGIALMGRLASRQRGSEGAVALGSLAGLGFSAAAIASRPLAGHDSVLAFVSDPLLYIVIVNSIIGQVLLAAAMQRGSTTAAVASMEAATAVPAAFFGVVLLGDKIAPGRTWLRGPGLRREPRRGAADDPLLQRTTRRRAGRLSAAAATSKESRADQERPLGRAAAPAEARRGRAYKKRRVL